MQRREGRKKKKDEVKGFSFSVLEVMVPVVM